MLRYRNHTISVVQEGDHLAVEVRNSSRRLVGALGVSSVEEGIEEGKGLVDIRAKNRQR